jgi:predicted enzyme related to lactoylglutathione lyase
MIASGCAGSTPKPVTPTTAEAPAPAAAHKGLRIGLASVYVDDQDKALRFYTEVLGFAKKDDESNGGYRWLTVSAPGDTDGPALLLAANAAPAAKAYQQSLFSSNQPAVMFFTNDIQGDYARIKAAGAELTMPPTEVMPGSTIMMMKDGCGNLVQVTQLVR